MTVVDVDDQTRRRGEWRKVKLTVMNPDVGSDGDTPASHSGNYTTEKPSTRPPPIPGPPNLGSTNPPSKPHAEHNFSIAEPSDNPEDELSPPGLPSVQRMFSPARQVLSPRVQSAIDRIIVAVTRNTENYVTVDISGYTEAQVVREKILSKLDIPEDLHSTFSIYHTELHGYAIGGALDDTQLLIKCQLFGDDKSSLRFLVQRTGLAPTSAGAVGVFPLPRTSDPTRTRQPGKVHPGKPSGPMGQSDALDRQQQSQGPTVQPPPQPYLSQPQKRPARQKSPSRPLPPVPQYSGQDTLSQQEPQNSRSYDLQRLETMEPQHLAETESQRQQMPSQSSDQCEHHTSPPHTSSLQQPQKFKHPPPPPSIRHYQQQGRLPSSDQGVLGDQQTAEGQPAPGDRAVILGEEDRMDELVRKANTEVSSLAPAGGATPIQPYMRLATWVNSRNLVVRGQEDDKSRDEDGGTCLQTSEENSAWSADSVARMADRQSASQPKAPQPRIDGAGLPDADSTPGSTPTTIDAPLRGDPAKAPFVAEVSQVPPTGSGTGRQNKSLRMTTAERKKAFEQINAARTLQRASDKTVDSDSDSDSDSIPATGYFTRRNAKIWSGRQKITPGATSRTSTSPQDPGIISDRPRQQRRMLKRANARLLGSADGVVQDVETDDPTSNIRSIVMIQSGQISCEEMFQHLIAHGCTDLSSDMDPEQYSSGFIIGGAFGDIWKGKLRDGTDVAIKVWRFTSLLHDGSKAMKRAMREIYYWSKAKHEYVQELMGVIMFQGRLGMVSLWMEHGNLREYLYKNPSVDRYSLCFQVASGVAYLHSQDMVHGDLKGMNVLVSLSGAAKLSDFDHAIMSECSLAFSETSKLGGGTTRWMAPELLFDEDCRRSAYTDMYALGMTMLEIITGTSPYYPQCKEDVNVIMAVMKRQLPTRPMDHLGDNPRDNRMWELLLSCWNYDPLARPKSAEVVESLQGIMALPTSDPV